MHDWIDQALWSLDRGQGLMLVSVAWVQGSTPREAGAKMLISAERQWFTIGGGHLEWIAADSARKRLHAEGGPARWIERQSLGPSLGQCCGGVVHLLFERLDEPDRCWLAALRDHLQGGHAVVRQVSLAQDGSPAPVRIVQAPVLRSPDEGDPDKLLSRDAQGAMCYAERIAPATRHIVVFGAGHVGQALVQILGTLPCRVAWVDEREEMFPADLPANVRIEATDAPETIIDQSPAQSCFLIMTHDHALDQRLCEHLLRRDDAAYIGLIGSMTKRRKFEHRFRARGIPEERYHRIVCPIGQPGITGKQPAVIAVAVAAQLLQVRAHAPAHPAEAQYASALA